MKILTTRNFDKQYAKLRPQVKKQFKNKIELFSTNPFDATLKNHALKGKYLGYRSINISGDMRVLYTVKSSVLIVLAFIDT